MDIPSTDDLLRLPRWARVAFAARCARHVQPFYSVGWPKGPGPRSEHIAAIEAAIAWAEYLTTVAGAVRGADAPAPDVINEAAHAAHPMAAAAHAVAVAAGAAAEAANAARISDGASAADAAIVVQAASSARTAAYDPYAAAAADYAVVKAIKLDYQRLLAAAKREKWTNDTPVPPMFFEPLRPCLDLRHITDAMKTQPPADKVPPLTLLIRPGSATPQEIGRLLAEISALYRMLGGSGIAFKLEDLSVPAEEGVPV